MKLKSLLLSLLVFTYQHATAQLSSTQHQRIDSLFSSWDKPNHPGGVVGIIQKDKTVFIKEYGLASLEYNIPNTTGMIFNTGSVSKQFTAMGIVLLHNEGKLSVDDDIRKYLPELPVFEHTITIRHMLHHTSGLRSLHALLGLAGWRGDDSRTNEDINRFMELQQDLNFVPGDEYLYCNTGFMLMVNIIEKVTGEKFPAWMKKSIFEPLGMNSSYVENNYARVVPNNATSYYSIGENKFDRAVEYWGYVGSGNMHATTEDLLIWLSNFYAPKPGWEKHFSFLQTLDNFNNGTKNNYAFGVSIGEFNGIKSVGHGGAIGGFRANVVVYPKEELGIAILTNFSAGNPGRKSNEISEILFGTLAKSNTNVVSNIKGVKRSKKELEIFTGSYWNDKENYSRRIYLRDDTLRYARSSTNESALIPIGKSEFQMLIPDVDVKIKFEIQESGKKMQIIEPDTPPTILQWYEQKPVTANELSVYTGKFYSPELETTYTIYIKDDALYYHHPRHGDYEMEVLKADVLEGAYPFSIVKFKRDKSGEVTGVLVSNGRVRNAWFEKIE